MTRFYNLVLVLLVCAYGAQAQSLTPEVNSEKSGFGTGIFNKQIKSKKTLASSEIGANGLGVTFANERNAGAVEYDSDVIVTESEYFFERRYIQEITSTVPLSRQWGGQYIMLRSNDTFPYLWKESLVNDERGGRLLESVDVYDINKAARLSFFRSYTDEDGWKREISKKTVTSLEMQLEEEFLFDIQNFIPRGKSKKIQGIECFRFDALVSQTVEGTVHEGNAVLWIPNWNEMLPALELINKKDGKDLATQLYTDKFFWPLEMDIFWGGGFKTQLRTDHKEIHPLVIEMDNLANVFSFENFIPLTED